MSAIYAVTAKMNDVYCPENPLIAAPKVWKMNNTENLNCKTYFSTVKFSSSVVPFLNLLSNWKTYYICIPVVYIYIYICIVYICIVLNNL